MNCNQKLGYPRKGPGTRDWGTMLMDSQSKNITFPSYYVSGRKQQNLTFFQPVWLPKILNNTSYNPTQLRPAWPQEAYCAVLSQGRGGYHSPSWGITLSSHGVLPWLGLRYPPQLGLGYPPPGKHLGTRNQGKNLGLGYPSVDRQTPVKNSTFPILWKRAD